MSPERDGSVGRPARIEPDVLPEGAPRILGTVKRHPHLLEPMLGFSAALANGALPRRASEILALRAAWNCGSAFEWGHHTRYGRDAGLTQDEIDRLAGGDPGTGWNAAEEALVRAADELHAGQDVSDATWAQLAESLDEGQLVEVPFVVGQYTMLSMVAKATGVPVDPSLPGFPSEG
ncbi:MAG: carboxymuconolactone decarboxylase family protein [Myxococcota bacterium]